MNEMQSTIFVSSFLIAGRSDTNQSSIILLDHLKSLLSRINTFFSIFFQHTVQEKRSVFESKRNQRKYCRDLSI